LCFPGASPRWLINVMNEVGSAFPLGRERSTSRPLVATNQRVAVMGCLPVAVCQRAVQSRDLMFPIRYELGFYIPEDCIFHSHCYEDLKTYIALTGWAL
jgi:hypothetical protein